MTTTQVPRWLAWAREIQALSQTGLAFSENDYERQRYTRLAEIAAEILHSHTGLPEADLLAGFLEQPGYATPKVDVRGAVVRDGQILLVQERVDERWCMPGGWADVGDLPSETVIREVWEESGFHVVPRSVVGVYDANRSGRPLSLYHAYKIVFQCQITGGQARTSHETLAVGFFPFDDLPPLSSNRTHPRHLADVQARLQDPQRPARFD
ncbi:MAG: NUDIX hydrolase [Anaerolineae bacterium]|jgi:ADP-ribose pyrophosphatase YjhB (NUDIX family)